MLLERYGGKEVSLRDREKNSKIKIINSFEDT